MSEATTPVDAGDEGMITVPPRLTSVGSIYAGATYITTADFHSLYSLFSTSMIYTRDFENVIKLNDFFLAVVPSPPIHCHSLRLANSSPYAKLTLHAWPQKSLRKFPSVTLTLKVGMPIRLSHSISTNYDVDEGARLLITEIDTQAIYARLFVNDRYGKLVRIERITTSCRDPFNPYLTYVRQQFPVEPAFASLLCYQIDDSTRVYAIFKSHQL
ncbi:hypothetical protein MJO28_016763 [Puccinia striiformis f. sp. tritici]|uniref:Uncharacterized protein n=1 Tax=Puccinia striiformis f. sp. tritici TaxID=168172 RepID=A0ACC0DP18_9BASI|nr:hypothetical protein Pst134EB_030716 [Puccinia striiformis f. sp. tritici]KAI7933916.1 hypothetical protein MJO29_016630 [Puccinia striiformis f. sp. tritici]KAI7934622.1 hypothetical protein MJO29_015885 [Puccinia striiformis f. sp. tritici]KAI7935892.1 hypothetical protein MJO28_016763 [Puccinia striiformis f. sp. tritici]